MNQILVPALIKIHDFMLRELELLGLTLMNVTKFRLNRIMHKFNNIYI